MARSQPLPVLVIDTREQERHECQYGFPAFPTVRRKLDVGDYAVDGLEQFGTIERKRLDDFLACCGTERKRFLEEIERAAGSATRLYVVIEATRSAIESGRYRSEVHPHAALGTISMLRVRWGVEVIYAGDFRGGRDETERILVDVWEEEQARRAAALDPAPSAVTLEAVAS